MLKDIFESFNSKKELTEDEMIRIVSDVNKFLKDSDFENIFNNTLEEELSNPESTDKIYTEITNYYFILLNILEISDFKSFRFPDYDDCRIITVDGQEYDLNDCFDHDDIEASEALCAIDCLIADLQSETTEPVLDKVEEMINHS